MLGIGRWVTRRTSSGEDFPLAERELGTPLVMGSTLAALVGTGSSLGAVGFAHQNGWAGMPYGIGGAAGVFLLLWLFSDVRKHGFMTFAEKMSHYYGAGRAVKGVTEKVAGAIASMPGGSVATLGVDNVESFTAFWGNAVIPSLLAALVVGVVVSLVTPRTQVSKEEATGPVDVQAP